jgi:hypothetical protein
MSLEIEDADFAHHQTQLDRDWRAPKTQLRYAKPSTELLNLRVMAQQMIRTKRFAGIGVITQAMNERMVKETASAASRMASDYRQADANLRKTYELHRSTVNLAHESRLNNIVRERERSLKPHKRTAQKIQDQAAELQALSLKPQPDTIIPPPILPNCDNALLSTINKTPRLKLPQLQTLPRRPSRPPSQAATQASGSRVSGLDVTSRSVPVSALVPEKV